MCHYVTAYVPKGADVATIEGLLDENKFGFKVFENSHVQNQLSRPVIQILTTRKFCDCGTTLASAREFVRGAEPSQHDLTKLRKKGWSESRIRRWVEEKTASVQQQPRTDAGPETNRWTRAISQILTSRSAGWIGLLVHEYSRGLNSERIELQSPNKVRLAELTEDTLLKMSEDKMLIVHL